MADQRVVGGEPQLEPASSPGGPAQGNSDQLVWLARQQRLWSLAAGSRKQRLQRWRSIALALVVAGAVLAALAAQVRGTSEGLARALGVVAAVAVAIVPVIRAKRVDLTATREWTRARAVSEALKSELYRYLAGVGDYAKADRDARLRSTGQDVLHEARDVAHVVVEVDVEPNPRIPPVSDAQSYAEERLVSQVDGFYRPKAAAAARRLRRARAIEFIASVTAAALAALAAIEGFGGATAWVSVATTVTAAVVAHIAAAHYEDEVVGYTATANRLDFLHDEWSLRTGGGPDRDADSELVEQCEQAILAENKGWMAQWQSLGT